MQNEGREIVESVIVAKQEILLPSPALLTDNYFLFLGCLSVGTLAA